MSKTIDNQKAFYDALIAEYSKLPDTVTRTQIAFIVEKYSITRPRWLTKSEEFRVDRGVYRLPNVEELSLQSEDETEALEDGAIVIDEDIDANVEESLNLIPRKISGYVPFGHFSDVEKIIASKRFYPSYIQGLSGNGKTMMIEQICAKVKREMIRVNITAETDEDDLIGGFRLVNGETVWHSGPVITAMERGAILLLDEVDLGSIKLMCLQPVLEGKSVYLKKIGKLIRPLHGFNIVATANTKGRGSDDGKFIGTNVMNEAFLERFAITLIQEYPPAAQEKKMLRNVLDASGATDDAFADILVKWAEITRKTYYDDGVSDLISTRRLVHICDAYSIFDKERLKVIELCLNRFDDDVKRSFLDLYNKLDADAIKQAEIAAKAAEQRAAAEAMQAEMRAKGQQPGTATQTPLPVQPQVSVGTSSAIIVPDNEVIPF